MLHHNTGVLDERLPVRGICDGKKYINAPRRSYAWRKITEKEPISPHTQLAVQFPVFSNTFPTHTHTHTHTPVSYTHLDVYKRQFYN